MHLRPSSQNVLADLIREALDFMRSTNSNDD